MAEEAEHKGKTTWTNFKRIVWHESFRHILSTIRDISRTGYQMRCADGTQRLLFPFIHTLIADYEEQYVAIVVEISLLIIPRCVMSLTRGVMGNFPCPVCLVPSGAQSKLEVFHPRRTAESVRAIVMDPSLNKTQKEEHLKLTSFRDVEVCLTPLLSVQLTQTTKNAFWDIEHSDPTDALAFDRLHSNHGGVFSDHLFEELQRIATDVGREAIGIVDAQYVIVRSSECNHHMTNFRRTAALPRWRNLNHFESIMKVQFTDGSKYEDISKVRPICSQ